MNQDKKIKFKSVLLQTLSWGVFTSSTFLVIPEVYRELKALWAILLLSLLSFSIHKKKSLTQILSDRIYVCIIMSLLAIVVVMGTFSQAFAITHQKDILCALFVLISASLLHYSWQLFPNKKGVRGVFLIAAHMGSLLLLLGALISFGWGKEGFVNLSVSGRSSVYFELKNGTPTGKVLDLPKIISLKNFETEYHKKDLLLYIYHHKEVVQVYSLEESLELKVGNSKLKIHKIYKDLEKRKSVESSKNPTGLSAIKVSLNTPEGEDSDWLTATDEGYGFIRKNAEKYLVRFFKNTSQTMEEIPFGELHINAENEMWRTSESSWAMLPEKLTVELDDRKIIVENFIAEATVQTSYENASDQFKNPAVEIEISGDENKKIWLSPMLPKPLSLKDGYKVRVLVSQDEPKFFESLILLDGQEHSLSVNKPIRSGICRIYQADFDKNNSNFSGFRVACDPGAPLFKLGALTVLISLLGCAVFPARRGG